MIIKTSLTLSLFAAIASAGDVVQLTDKNFDDEMAKFDLALVKFYAPWCGHCKRMAPEMEKAATILKENDPPVAMVEVDCTTEKEVCQRFEVSGYPTLRVFRHGKKVADYSGGRQAADFVKTMAGQAGPGSSEFSCPMKYKKLIGTDKPVIIAFFKDEKADGVKAYMKAADELREKYKFAHTFSEHIAQEAGKEQGTITLFRPALMKSKFEEQVVDYDKSKFTVGLIRNWVKATGAGLAQVLASADQDDAGYPQVVCLYNVDYERDPKGTQYWRNRVMKVAKNFKEGKTAHIKFAVGNHADWNTALTEAGKGSHDGKKPACVIFDDKNTKYVMYEEDWTMDTFEAFVNSYNDGKIKPHVKSQEDPDNTGKANLVLTANNFKDHVDGKKDAFIKFYAPWCGHCKSLAPKWEEMAENFKDDDDVIIADFDADSNDLPGGFEVTGFPTIYWLPAGGQPIKYQSGREVEAMTNYVKENRSVKKDEL